MSANFTQVSGPGGRVQTFDQGALGPTLNTATNTFIWNPASLKGQLDGGDFIYAKRVKFRTWGTMTSAADTTARPIPPNWEQLAQIMGSVRVFSQFMGEMLPKSLNSVPLLANHDMYFVNGFRPITRKRGQTMKSTSTSTTSVEYVFEAPFEREYLTRGIDSVPWLPFLEGGIFEVDLRAAATLSEYGVTMTGNWNQTCTVDWYCDKQAQIPSPVQSRLYRVSTTGPEYVLKSVGSPQGLDGVASGCRLAVLSWLMKGATASESESPSTYDNGFYSIFGATGGLQLGTNGLTRLDVPFRTQVSVDDVSAWFESFISDVGPLRMIENMNVLAYNNTTPGTGLVTDDGSNDMAGWPYAMDPRLTMNPGTGSLGGENVVIDGQSLIRNAANFFPLVWPGHGDKISDFQKVNGDLSFTATLTDPPQSSILNLFRSDEICSYTMAKIYDIMARMGLPHKDTGGAYTVVPKYGDGKRADATTRWGLPLKIVQAGPGQ